TAAVPLGDSATSWPLAPEPGAPRSRPAAAEESLQWHLPAEPAAPMPAPAPVAAPAAARRPAAAARPVDTLAGLAHELSRPAANGEFASPAPRATPSLDIPAARPTAPQAQPAAHDAGGDQNLADMAQRLEAALRRPGAPAARPAPITAAPSAPAQNAGLASAPRIDSLNGARDKAAKPEPAAAPDQGGAVFGSLEQEMASLLGRPSGKQ
ncbi:MAG: hypothetical protein ABUL48_02350, partial [Pseudorhodoplanes sp.]